MSIRKNVFNSCLDNDGTALKGFVMLDQGGRLSDLVIQDLGVDALEFPLQSREHGVMIHDMGNGQCALITHEENPMVLSKVDKEHVVLLLENLSDAIWIENYHRQVAAQIELEQRMVPYLEPTINVGFTLEKSDVEQMLNSDISDNTFKKIASEVDGYFDDEYDTLWDDVEERVLEVYDDIKPSTPSI